MEQRQKYVSADFPQYHLDILESINELCPLKEKVIIDVGGSNIPTEVMRLFGVKKFVCLDPVSKWLSFHSNDIPERYYGKKIYKIQDLGTALKNEFSFILDEDAENIRQEMAGLFDVAFSISTFEHVTSLEKTLEVIYGLLKPQGILYSQYEPIFSSVAGHHVYISEEFNFNNMPEIEHMHLLYARGDAELFLNKIDRFDSNVRKGILEQAYDSKIINRFMLQDHINAFQNAKFNKYQITYFYIHPVPEERLEILCSKYGQMRFDVRGIRYVANKDE